MSYFLNILQNSYNSFNYLFSNCYNFVYYWWFPLSIEDRFNNAANFEEVKDIYQDLFLSNRNKKKYSSYNNNLSPLFSVDHVNHDQFKNTIISQFNNLTISIRSLQNGQKTPGDLLAYYNSMVNERLISFLTVNQLRLGFSYYIEYHRQFGLNPAELNLMMYHEIRNWIVFLSCFDDQFNFSYEFYKHDILRYLNLKKYENQNFFKFLIFQKNLLILEGYNHNYNLNQDYFNNNYTYVDVLIEIGYLYKIDEAILKEEVNLLVVDVISKILKPQIYSEEFLNLKEDRVFTALKKYFIDESKVFEKE